MNFNKLEAFQDSLQEVYGIPATDCKITKDHQVVYRHMTGCRDYAGQFPVSDQDLYRLYSATKVITATAVLQLMERKKLDLYDDVRRFLPEFTNLKAADQFELDHFPIEWPNENTKCHLMHGCIRIIDLLTMTAGLSYDTEAAPLRGIKKANNDKPCMREAITALAAKLGIYEPLTP